MISARSRLILLATLAALLPLVPFLIWGEQLELWVQSQLHPDVPPWQVGLGMVALLSSDFFLPIPSGPVSAFGGAQLGVPLATAASWLGMTLGAIVGYGLGTLFGRPLAVRLSSEEDLQRLEPISRRHGPLLLALARGLPILAEASVLVVAVMRIGWWRFLVPVALSNLVIAYTFSLLGHYGRVHHLEAYALAASIALPLLAATIIRLLLRGPGSNDA